MVEAGTATAVQMRPSGPHSSARTSTCGSHMGRVGGQWASWVGWVDNGQHQACGSTSVPPPQVQTKGRVAVQPAARCSKAMAENDLRCTQASQAAHLCELRRGGGPVAHQLPHVWVGGHPAGSWEAAAVASPGPAPIAAESMA